MAQAPVPSQLIGHYQATLPALNDGEAVWLNTDSTGALRVAGNFTASVSGGSTTVPAATITGGAVGVSSLPALATGTNTVGSFHVAGAEGAASAATAPTRMLLAGGEFNATPPGLTDGQAVALQTDSTGALKVSGATGSSTVTIGGGTVGVSSLPAVNVGTLPALPAGSNTIGTVHIASADTVNVNIEGGTATVSGSVTLANPGTAWRGSGGTDTTAAVTIEAASGASSLKTYVTDIEISNSGTTTTMVTFNDGSTATFIAPAGGGSNMSFNTPLVTAGNTALTFTPAAGSATIWVNAQGYIAP